MTPNRIEWATGFRRIRCEVVNFFSNGFSGSGRHWPGKSRHIAVWGINLGFCAAMYLIAWFLVG